MVKSWKQKIAKSGATLELFCKKVSDDDCKEIGPALAENSTITQLTLGGNIITGTGMVPLSEGLKANKTITTLLLGGNDIGDKGIILLVGALKENSTITEVDLGDNKITDKGIVPLCDALKKNSTLTKLNLDKETVPITDALKCNRFIAALKSGETSNKLRTLPLNKFINKSAFRVVLDAIPESVKVRDSDKKLPLWYASDHTPLENIALLLEKDLPVDEEDNPASQYGGSLHCLVSKDPQPGTFLTVFSKLLETCSLERIRALADSRDAQGRTTLSLALGVYREEFERRLFFFGRYQLRPGPPAYRTQTSYVVFADDVKAHASYEAAFCRRLEPDEVALSLEAFTWACEDVGLVLTDAIKSSMGPDEDGKFAATEFDPNGDGQVNLAEFVSFCCLRLHGSSTNKARRVVLKMMSQKDQFLNEKNNRENRDKDDRLDAKFVISAINYWDSEESSDEGRAFHEALQGPVAAERQLHKYPFAVVMDAADRNLQEIWDMESPQGPEIRAHFKQLVECVDHLHSRQLVHGDLKMKNVVRRDQHLLIIDLDAAANQNQENQYMGAKFSSSVLPPEMFVKLDPNGVKQFQLHFHSEKAEFDEAKRVDKAQLLWKKICPKKTRDGSFVAVRTFSTQGDRQKLSYELVPPGKAVDMWSLGVMFFKLCTGEALLCENRDGDLTNSADLATALSWTEQSIRDRIRKSKIPDRAAEDLLFKLLHPDPAKRCQDAQSVLSHCYFDPGGPQKELIEQLSRQMEKMDHQLEKISQRTLEISEFQHTSQLKLLGALVKMQSVLVDLGENVCPTAFCLLPTEPAELERSDASQNGVSRICKIFTSFQRLAQEALASEHKQQFLLDQIYKTCSHNFNMHLVCERCFEPQSGAQREDSPWPVLLSKLDDNKSVSRILPLAKHTLKAAKLFNGISKIGKLVGLPDISIPTDVLQSVDEAVGDLSKESSVADFDCMADVFPEDAASPSQQQKQTGFALREFQRLLEEKDPKQDWCGLSRIALIGAKKTCWVCTRCRDLLENGGSEQEESAAVSISRAEEHAVDPRAQKNPTKEAVSAENHREPPTSGSSSNADIREAAALQLPEVKENCSSSSRKLSGAFLSKISEIGTGSSKIKVASPISKRVLHEGSLSKKSTGFHRSYQDRYFVLTDISFDYYKTKALYSGYKGSPIPAGRVLLKGATVERETGDKKHPYKFVFSREADKVTHVLVCEDQVELDTWVN